MVEALHQGKSIYTHCAGSLLTRLLNTLFSILDKLLGNLPTSASFCLQVKPLLNVARTEDELRQKEEELNKLREKVQRDEASRKEIEEMQTQLMEEKNQLFIQLQRVSGTIKDQRLADSKYLFTIKSPILTHQPTSTSSRH